MLLIYTVEALAMASSLTALCATHCQLIRPRYGSVCRLCDDLDDCSLIIISLRHVCMNAAWMELKLNRMTARCSFLSDRSCLCRRCTLLVGQSAPAPAPFFSNRSSFSQAEQTFVLQPGLLSASSADSTTSDAALQHCNRPVMQTRCNDGDRFSRHVLWLRKKLTRHPPGGRRPHTQVVPCQQWSCWLV